MNELVERLTNGAHPIVAERSASSRELREQIERGFVLLKFPNTRGGTELGSQLDMKQTRLDGADFESGTGSVRLVGNLTLNYDKVQLVADIDLASLKGTGHLVLVEEAGASQHARIDSALSNGAASNGAASNGAASPNPEVQNTNNNGAANAAMAERDSQNVGKASTAKTKVRLKKKRTTATRVAQAN
jgi:hypothetical protein